MYYVTVFVFVCTYVRTTLAVSPLLLSTKVIHNELVTIITRLWEGVARRQCSGSAASERKRYRVLVDGDLTQDYARTILKDKETSVNYNYNIVILNVEDNYN